MEGWVPDVLSLGPWSPCPSTSLQTVTKHDKTNVTGNMAYLQGTYLLQKHEDLDFQYPCVYL